MILDKALTKEQLQDLFEEQKAAFSDGVKNGEKYRPRADFYTTSLRVATLTYPSFQDENDMENKFHMAAWLPKLLRADESILFLDTISEVVNKKTGETMESDVFMCLKTTSRSIDWEATPYYMNPDVEYPVWNTDYEVTESNVFGLHGIIASLNFAITNPRHNLDIGATISYLEANGFEIDFHYPFNIDAFKIMDNLAYF